MLRKAVVVIALILILCSLLATTIEVEGENSNNRITVDGDPADWPGSPPSEVNTGCWSEGVFIWRDEENDDTGAAGLKGGYVYPDLPDYYSYPGLSGVGGEADIREFRLTYDDENLYFMFILGSIKRKESLALIVAVDRDGKVGSGTDWLPFYIDMTLPPAHRFEFAVGYVGGQLTIVKPYLDYFQGEELNAKVSVDTSKRCIEISIPLRITGNPYGTWHLFVASGCGYPVDDESGYGGPGSDPDGFYDFCEILETTDEQLGIWTDHPGGGLKNGEPQSWSGWEDPDIFDLCFNGTRKEQEEFLSGCSVDPSTWVKISSDAILSLVFPSPALRIRFLYMNTNHTIEGGIISIYVTVEYPNGSLCPMANVSGTIRNAMVKFINLMNGTYVCHINTSGLAGYFSSREYLMVIMVEGEGYEPALTYVTFKVDPSFSSMVAPSILVLILVIAVTWTLKILISE